MQTGRASWRQELDALLDTVDQIFPGAIRSVYLIGSRSEAAALPDSDVDVSIVVNTVTDMAQVGQLFGKRTLPGGLRLDVHVDTLQILGSLGWEFLAAKLKYAGEPIRGDDVRNEIAEPDFNAFKARIFSEVRKGIGMLRNLSVDELDQLPLPIGFPDASRFFYGYEVVRKKDWYLPGTAEGTRELVAVATYCASAWVVSRHRTFVLSKTQAVRALRRIENGARADLTERIYRLCRTNWGGRVPDDEEDRTVLRGLCEPFLRFENEVLALPARS